MNQARREQGNIIVYVVIGVVLVGLLAGAIYLAKNQARVARDGGNETSTQAPAGDVGNKATDDNKADSGQPSDQEGKPPTPAADESTDTQNENQAAPSEEQEAARGGERQDETVPTTGPSTIASTGPEDFIGTAAVLAILLTAITAYLKSHRQLHSLK